VSESDLLYRLLVRGSELGARLFRNNVGKLRDARGRLVTYGLCVGSSDLIGYLPVTITPAMVGQRVAVFVAIEAKTATGRLRPEQRQFLRVVQGHGGLCCVARSVEDADALLVGAVITKQPISGTCDEGATGVN
jgi:hypothetical protein